MNWVWDHSRSKGNARIAVLFVADQVRTAACEVKLSYPALMRALNTKSKTTVRAALVAAEKLGELETAEESSGRRASLYRLPKAIGYSRSASRSGPETGPLETGSGPETGPQDQGDPSRSGPDSGPREDRSGPGFARSGPETGPPSPFPKEQASSEAPNHPDSFSRCQPLVKAMTEAGIVVSWSMKPSDWLDIAAVVDRAGVTAMVRYAVDTKATARQPIRYATFFLRGGWKGLPPAAANVPQPRPGGTKPPHCGDPDCDEISRTREVEDDRGIRSLQRCPACHPASKGQAA